MRNSINRSTTIDVRGIRQDRINVAARDVLRPVVVLVERTFARFFQAQVRYLAAKRCSKPASAGAAPTLGMAIETAIQSMCGLTRCWHAQHVVPHRSVSIG